MSYIHEALKKAQKERDALCHKYHGIVSASRYKPKFFSRKALWWTSFLLISLAFTAYLWLPSRGTQPPIRQPETPEVTPQPPPNPLPPAGEGGVRGASHKLLSKQPEGAVNAVALYEKAKLFQKSGRLQEAKQLYEETLNLDPDYVDALNNLGVIHIHDKKYAAAQSNFEKAIWLKPDYVDPYYNLACLHALQGKVTESLRYLKRAVSLDPSAKDWARTDTDLTNLHAVPGFEEIIGKNGVVE